MDDRVVSKMETIVSAGTRAGVLCQASTGGVFFCNHPDLDVLSRIIAPGDNSLSAQPRPGRDHVRISAGEQIGIVADLPSFYAGKDEEEVTLHVHESGPARKRKASSE